MNAEQYCKILEGGMEESFEKLEMEEECYFQQDNDPKHTPKQWFSDNNIQVLEGPAQFPDLNPIKHQ